MSGQHVTASGRTYSRLEATPGVRVARDIEALLQWAVVRCEGAHVAERTSVIRRDFEPHGVSGDGCAAVEKYAQLGTFIDASPHHGGPDRLHPDARALYQAIVDDWLVLTCARQQARPAWLPQLWAGFRAQPLQWVEKRNKKHDPVWSQRIWWGQEIYEPKTGKRYTPLVWEDARRQRDHGQRAYRQWHDQLCLLAARFSEGLRDYIATGPLASAMPWPSPPPFPSPLNPVAKRAARTKA